MLNGENNTNSDSCSCRSFSSTLLQIVPVKILGKNLMVLNHEIFFLLVFYGIKCL